MTEPMYKSPQKLEKQLEEIDQHLGYAVIEAFKNLQAELKAVKNSREGYKQLVDMSEDPSLLVSSEGYIIKCNLRFAEFVGKTPSDAIGTQFCEYLDDNDSLNCRNTLDYIASHEICINDEEYRLKPRSGQEKLLRLKFNKTYDPEGNFIGVHIGGRDITGISKLETLALTSEKMAALGQLTAGVCNEISTPCQTIQANMMYFKEAAYDIFDFLKKAYETLDCIEKNLKNEDNTYLKKISHINEELNSLLKSEYHKIIEALDDSIFSANKITGIVSVLSQLNHPDTQKKQSVNLNNIVEDALKVTSSEYKYICDGNIAKKLDFNIGNSYINTAVIEQVIINLITNASHAMIDYKQKSRIEKGSMEIGTKLLDDALMLYVKDNGGGIPQDIQHKIFERHFTTKQPGRGTGQGLAISEEMIKKQNGTIRFENHEYADAENKKQKGVTFYVTLPLITEPLES